MRRINSLITFLLLLSCSGNGIEGYVSEPITITAPSPDKAQDFDYFWSLKDQPDGSLISSKDLNSSDGGQVMIFIPDYPGDYSIELVTSKYGDEVENHTFSFTILDQKKVSIDTEEERDKDNNNNNNEEWLDDEYEDDEYEDDEYEDDEYEDDEYEDDEYEDDEYEDDEYEDDEYEDDEYEDDEYEDDEYKDDKYEEPVSQNKKIKHSTSATAELSKTKITTNNIPIAAKTDRYTIQIISKKIFKDAQKFANSLIHKGYDVYIQKFILQNNEVWYRVRIGSYDNYNAAKNASKILSSELGYATWVDFVRKEQ